ncbi:hypothetical protein GYA49_01185 [Candidatus Beckwithbacteria bacterium]|nr:hypothetical protein [Candidatus Beckwithbacteria bacterium]
MVSSQLQQGLLDLIYFTWLHNSQAIAYFLGACLALALQFIKPRRLYLLFFVGFLLLLIQFQYIKHIVDPLEQQTLQTVLQQGSQGVRFSRLTEFFLRKFVPLILYFGGWGAVFLGVILAGKPTDKPKLQ